MKRFEIFYANGQVVRGQTEQDWKTAPPVGVQVVVYLHDDLSAREKLHGWDNYTLHDDGLIVGTDGDPEKGSKVGTLIEKQAFDRIVERLEPESLIWHDTFTEEKTDDSRS